MYFEGANNKTRSNRNMPISKTPTVSLRRFGGTYAVIPSATIDIIKSPDALAILVWLLDRSDDWIIRREHLRTRFGLGRDRYDNAMSELKDLGLAWWEFQRDPGTGQITDKILNVGDVPIEKNHLRSENPQVGKPTSRGIPMDGKTDQLPITDILPITDGIEGDSFFDEFYTAYPKKVGKDAARKALKKLKPTRKLIDTIIANISEKIAAGEWCPKTHKQFIPNPATYLNQKKWKDEIIPRGQNGKQQNTRSEITRDYRSGPVLDPNEGGISGAERTRRARRAAYEREQSAARQSGMGCMGGNQGGISPEYNELG